MELIDKDKLDSFKYRSASERMDLPVDYMVGWNDAVDGIMANAPAVDAEPVRHGHWIELTDPVLSCVCSACGQEYRLYEDDICGYPYCAKCGARMDEEMEK